MDDSTEGFKDNPDCEFKSQKAKRIVLLLGFHSKAILCAHHHEYQVTYLEGQKFLLQKRIHNFAVNPSYMANRSCNSILSASGQAA